MAMKPKYTNVLLKIRVYYAGEEISPARAVPRSRERPLNGTLEKTLRFLQTLKKQCAPHRLLPLRRRYVLTRSNRLRMRYVVAGVTVFAFSATSLFGAMGSSIAFTAPQIDVALTGKEKPPVVKMASFAPEDVSGQTDEAFAALEPAYGREDGEDAKANLRDQRAPLGPPVDAYEKAENNFKLASLFLKAKNAGGKNREAPEEQIRGPREERLQIDAGQTVAGVLQEAGVSGTDAHNAVEALSEYFDPRLVKAGQAISVMLEPRDGELALASLNIKIDPLKEVVVSKEGKEGFKSELKEKDVVLQTSAANAEIENSLYGSAARAGIPASVVAKMIRIYSYEIDFQREIRAGDKVEVLYETYKTEDGDFARYGNVLYANLNVGGKDYPVYRYEDKNGNADFYNPLGESIKKSLMRTPVDGARISSDFGMRRHPVLGYNKMHKGMDFAAPLGTPIYAAGDGTVELAGRKGGYGNYVRIRHNGSLKTAYAHMHKFAKGIKPGRHVNQGDVIGYVGSTGRSTGPHLHYEVLQNNKPSTPAISRNPPETSSPARIWTVSKNPSHPCATNMPRPRKV